MPQVIRGAQAESPKNHTSLQTSLDALVLTCLQLIIWSFGPPAENPHKPQNPEPLNPSTPKPLNPKLLNLKPLNPKPLNPKPLNLKPLNP